MSWILAINLIITVLGIVLVLMLMDLLRKARDKTRLSQYRGQGEGTADLLNFGALVEDGILVNKDGSLMAAWRYRCADTASSTDAEQEHLSAAVNRALQPLGNGWMLHIDAVRQPAASYGHRTRWPDPVTEAIDNERRTQFEARDAVYEGYFVLTLTYLPPVLAQTKFVELMFDDDAPGRDKKTHSDHVIGAFKRDLRALESRLPFKLDRLKAHSVMAEHGPVVHDDFLRFLHFCTTGITHPVKLPKSPAYLDLFIGGQDLHGGVIPKIGRHYIQVVALEGFPHESAPGMLNVLSELPVEYRWSTRFIVLDPHEAVSQLEKYRKKWRQKVRGVLDQMLQNNSGVVDQDALDMVEDAEAAIAEVNSGLVAQGYYTSVVVLMGEDRDQVVRSAEQVYRVVNRLGFAAARVEDVNTLEAWLGSIPGHAVQNVRRPLVNSFNLADMMPTSTIWVGEDRAPCPFYPPNSPPLMHCLTGGATPFRLNLHVRDVGHTLMFGPTGAGKSTHLAILAAQMRRYPGMRVFAFDKGLSLYPLVRAVHASTNGKSGLHFSLGDGELAFAPLQFLETNSDAAWAMEWVDLLLGLNGIQTTPDQRNEIGKAIRNMAETGATSLTDLMLTLQDSDMRAVLEQYTVRGSMGHLLDASEDALSLSDLTCFEIEELMGLGDRFALPVLWYLFRRIERSLDGKPAAILLDEAWIMLGHPVFREKIREWLKVLRKANCLVLLATQSLSDASRSGILDVLVESCATKIFLPNPNAREESATALYEGMGLNARQIEIIAAATPKKHYYYVSEQGRRLYELDLGPVALAFCGASGKDDLERIRALESQWGHGWVKHWLADRGLNPADVMSRREAA